MSFLKEYKKEFLFAGPVLAILGLLLYLETQLPFFAKFLPVDENKLIIIVLNLNVLLILLLIFLVTRILIRNYIEKKRGIWGSGLRIKLTLTMLLISIIPSFTLFIITTGIFHRSMENWFGQKIEDTIDDAVELSRLYYDELFEKYEQTTKLVIQDVEREGYMGNRKALQSYLDWAVKANVADYMAVYDHEGNLAGQSGQKNSEATGKLAEKARQLLRGPPARVILPLEAGELISVGAPITDRNGNAQAVLFAGNISKVQSLKKLRVIAASYKEYRDSRPFRKILKYSVVIPLSLVTILTIFASVWVGMKMATEISVPIQKVKEGAAIIAKGKFDINLEDRGRDEINTLVQAFNSMARELKTAKDEIEEKRRHMEVILDNSGTGIISTDKNGTLLLLNRAAQQILKLDEGSWRGKALKDIFGNEFRRHMRPFLKEAREIPGATVIREIRLQLQDNVTNIRASMTVLKDDQGRTDGFIITFDDITHIVRAEKLATWREIAKRLTHEIKNPLTPILLSAERIRRRLLPRSAPPDKTVLDETTSVIIKSTEEIKRIVNELTKLGHLSQPKGFEDITGVVEETFDIHRNLYQNITFHLDSTEGLSCRLDREAIKRALVNLISNAVKALEGMPGRITLSTRPDLIRGMAVVEVIDTGRGIPDEDKPRIFDPYFTRDEDGTGLGLAIVQATILEHQGRITVTDNKPSGTRFIIELPLAGT